MKTRAAMTARQRARDEAEPDVVETRAHDVTGEPRTKARKSSIRFVLEDGFYADEQPKKTSGVLKVVGAVGVAAAVAAYGIAPRLIEPPKAEPTPVVAAPAAEKTPEPAPQAAPAPTPEVPATPAAAAANPTTPQSPAPNSTTASGNAALKAPSTPAAKSPMPATAAAPAAKPQPKALAAAAVARVSDNPYASAPAPKPKSAPASQDNPY